MASPHEARLKIIREEKERIGDKIIALSERLRELSKEEAETLQRMPGTKTKPTAVSRGDKVLV